MFTKRSHLLNTHYLNNNNNNSNEKCVNNHAQCMDAVSYTFLKNVQIVFLLFLLFVFFF